MALQCPSQRLCPLSTSSFSRVPLDQVIAGSTLVRKSALGEMSYTHYERRGTCEMQCSRVHIMIETVSWGVAEHLLQWEDDRDCTLDRVRMHLPLLTDVENATGVD